MIFLSFFFFSVLAQSLSEHNFTPSLKITSASRTINIATHIEKVSISLNVKNIDEKSTQEFIIALPKGKMSHLSFLEGSASKKKSGKLLFAEPIELKNQPKTNSTEECAFFKLKLPKPLAPQASTTLSLTMAFTHTLKPLPEQIKQDENQFVLYSDNLHIFSVYPIEKQSTLVQLQSNRIESYTKKHIQVTRADNQLTYGEFKDIPPLSFQLLQIHYQNNAPFVTFTSMRKDVEISQWGNIAIEEHYKLKHTGAKLTGPFNRVQYQRMGNSAPSAFNKLTAFIPLQATQIYYRDVIGNVSTSHVRLDRKNDRTRVEVQTRFPMFGGWTSDFLIGYNVPSLNYLSRSLKNADQHVLNISFGSMFEAAATDDAVVRVILPEGAHNIQFLTPFELDNVYQTTHLTHLDTTGRPVLVMKKKDVIKHHDQLFLVSYEFQTISMLREPLLVVVVFLSIFALAMIYYRIDLSFEHGFDIHTESKLSKAKTS